MQSPVTIVTKISTPGPRYTCVCDSVLFLVYLEGFHLRTLLPQALAWREKQLTSMLIKQNLKQRKRNRGKKRKTSKRKPALNSVSIFYHPKDKWAAKGNSLSSGGPNCKRQAPICLPLSKVKAAASLGSNPLCRNSKERCSSRTRHDFDRKCS